MAPVFSPISPTALDRPPAPQSVMAWKSGPLSWSRACRITSSIFFSVMALPICTACGEFIGVGVGEHVGGEGRAVDAIAAGAAADDHDVVAGLGAAFVGDLRGITPTVPQNTSGLPT